MAAKGLGFYCKGNDWFCTRGLPSDITIIVDEAKFHLHKFPLVSKCGKIVKIIEESSQNTDKSKHLTATLEDFPGNSDTFLIVSKFCYGIRFKLTPKNIMAVYCASNYLEMTEEYEEQNLLSRTDSYFHKNILQKWKDCILALQNSEPILEKADKLKIEKKCLDSISMMVCTDPSLFGWPMKMYGSLQSPKGSILWNGINTGAKVRCTESDWWFEDISYLNINLFKRLIHSMESRGIRPENLAGAIMYYAKKYLPGLSRWQGAKISNSRNIAVASYSLTPVPVDEKVLLETIEKILPNKKGKLFCRFLLSLLRVALILGVDSTCVDSLECRIGMQLEFASLDGLLIPNYVESKTLYNTECVEKIIGYYTSAEKTASSFSPVNEIEIEMSPSSQPLIKVGKLIDSYIAEVACDANLKPEKIQLLAEALPESSRSLHDGLYRAIDIYLKAHPWLGDKEKEQLCNIIDYRKLSIEACTHASQNKRLPLRIVLQVLYFEQMHLRTALAGCLHVTDPVDVPGPTSIPADATRRVIQRDGWVTVVRENRGLKVDMERMRSRVMGLEQEFGKMREVMKKRVSVSKTLSSPRSVAKKIRCHFLPGGSDVESDVIESTGPSPRSSVDHQRSSRHSRHRNSSSLL